MKLLGKDQHGKIHLLKKEYFENGFYQTNRKFSLKVLAGKVQFRRMNFHQRQPHFEKRALKFLLKWVLFVRFLFGEKFGFEKGFEERG